MESESPLGGVAWFEENQSLTQSRQNFSRTGQNPTVLFGKRHMAG
jgi:hypothetical protein